MWLGDEAPSQNTGSGEKTVFINCVSLSALKLDKTPQRGNTPEQRPTVYTEGRHWRFPGTV